MSFGLRTWNKDGVVQMDTDTFTYQVIHNQVYNLLESVVISVPIAGFSPSNCVASILPISLPSQYKRAADAMPYQSVAEGVVTVRARNPSESDIQVGSQITFRLLVMRYKN